MPANLPAPLTRAWKGLSSNPPFFRLSSPVQALSPRRCTSVRLLSSIAHPSSQHWQQQQQQQHGRSARNARQEHNPFPRFLPVTLLLAGGLLAAVACQEVAYADAPDINYIRLADVKHHGKDAERKWIIRGTQVYDITDWIPGHPGGDVILRAVGSSIDRYWDIFAIHKRDDVYAVLNEYYIGDIDPRDLVNGQLPCEGVDDPFVRDPERDPDLIVHTSKPCNAETPTSALETFITPNEKFYVRNHLWVPGITENEAKDHDLAIELPDGTEKVYSLKDLRSKFSPVTITATLQCSGNRRSHLTQHARPAHGLPWKVGAISTSEWTGVRLRDVLADAGFDVDDWNDDEVKHAQFVGAEAYGASIPIEKAVSRRGDVLLVYEMGGAPIPADHGYPLRVLVPGTTASRSVKWLKKIVLSEEECQSQWQQRDYRLAGPNQQSKGYDWSSSPAIQETPVQSAITSVGPCKEKRDMIQMSGYAFSGGGRRIVRVDVSADGGKTWHQAELLPDDAKGYKAWAWKRWRWTVPHHMAGEVFVVKAVDESYNTQPDGYEAHYNFRGLLTTAWHRMEWKKENSNMTVSEAATVA